MKLFALIFSVFIASLNVIPVLELIEGENEVTSCCSTSCHSSNVPGESNESNDDGCDDDCNPFMSCHTCMGCTLPSTPLIYKSKVTVTKEYSHYRDAYSFNFAHAVWNPPKVG